MTSIFLSGFISFNYLQYLIFNSKGELPTISSWKVANLSALNWCLPNRVPQARFLTKTSKKVRLSLWSIVGTHHCRAFFELPGHSLKLHRKMSIFQENLVTHLFEFEQSEMGFIVLIRENILRNKMMAFCEYGIRYNVRYNEWWL